MDDCVFCRIAAGTAPAPVIWEDADHMAFLSVNPNTLGFTVVIPRAHASSYVADLDDVAFLGLHLAARTAARLLDAALPDVARTGIMYEGYGIDHAHAKLFPMHGTAGTAGVAWRPVSSTIDTYFDAYRGYLSSHDSHRADDAELARLAERIHGGNRLA